MAVSPWADSLGGCSTPDRYLLCWINVAGGFHTPCLLVWKKDGVDTPQESVPYGAPQDGFSWVSNTSSASLAAPQAQLFIDNQLGAQASPPPTHFSRAPIGVYSDLIPWSLKMDIWGQGIALTPPKIVHNPSFSQWYHCQ